MKLPCPPPHLFGPQIGGGLGLSETPLSPLTFLALRSVRVATFTCGGTTRVASWALARGHSWWLSMRCGRWFRYVWVEGAVGGGGGG